MQKESKDSPALLAEGSLCPSYVCKPGAQLFGVVGSDGSVEYLDEPMPIDETFVNEAKKGRTPEERFRFTGKCIEKGCGQWDSSGHQCGVAKRVLEMMEGFVASELQHCGIRSKCRWFGQEGAKACGPCSVMVRNAEFAYHEQAT